MSTNTTDIADLVKNISGVTVGGVLPMISTSSNAQQTTGVTLTTSNGQNIGTSYRWVGVAGQTAEDRQRRYGNLQNKVPGNLLLRGTSYAKPVKITAVLDNVIIESATINLRVFQELSHFGYSYIKDVNFYAPTLEQVNDLERVGSYGYPTLSNWGGIGAYCIWWVCWSSSLPGNSFNNGIIIDQCNVAVNQANLVGESSDFWTGDKRTNGIEFFHGVDPRWNNTYGLKFHTDEVGINYFIDDSTSPATKPSGSLPVAPTTVTKKVVYDGEDKIEWVDYRPADQPQPGTGTTLLKPGSTTYDLKWSNINVTQLGKPTVPVALSAEDFERIRILEEHSPEIKQPTNLNGVHTISQGAGQNCVFPNMDFWRDITTGSSSKWVPQPIKGTGGTYYYIFPTVVDGEQIAQLTQWPIGGSNAATIDNKWVPNKEEPGYYWYVLPKVIRSLGGTTCCKNSLIAASDTMAINQYKTGSDCAVGRHWGKFLKTEFDKADLDDWTYWLEQVAAKEAQGATATATFNGWIAAPKPPPSPKRIVLNSGAQVLPIQFSLKSLERFSGFRNAAVIAPATGGGDKGGGDEQESGVIAKLKGAFSATKIYEWNADSIGQFISEQAREIGVPLKDVKEDVIELFAAAKLAWYMITYRMSPDVAKRHLEGDPIYKALQAVVITGSPGATGDSGSKPPKEKNKPSDPTKPKSNAKKEKSPTQTIRIQVTRGLPGYQPVIRTALHSTKPMLVQNYEYFDRETNVGKTQQRLFEFPFVPNQVNYSGLGAQWTEIERTGRFPVVDWTSFQLLKISFQFDVVDRAFENQIGFGLYHSCEDQIRTLRLMASAPYPVTFLNMDRFMNEEIRFPLFTRGRGVEFVISEFSVTSMQRTPTSSSQNSAFPATANQISRAQCQMTLQEIPIENVDIVQMPPIKPCKNKKGKPKCEDTPVTEENLRRYLLLTKGVQRT